MLSMSKTLILILKTKRKLNISVRKNICSLCFSMRQIKTIRTKTLRITLTTNMRLWKRVAAILNKLE